MARGVLTDTFPYEIDVAKTDTRGVTTRTVQAICLIQMDKFNVGSDSKKINAIEIGTRKFLPFRTSLQKTENTIGIHPRYLVGEYIFSNSNAANCYGNTPKRRVEIPVLSLAQFSAFKVYDKALGGTQEGTIIKINHSRNGATSLEYRIIKKVDQRLV